MGIFDRMAYKWALKKELKRSGFILETSEDGILSARTESKSQIYRLENFVVYTDNIDKTDSEMTYKEAIRSLREQRALFCPFPEAQPSF